MHCLYPCLLANILFQFAKCIFLSVDVYPCLCANRAHDDTAVSSCLKLRPERELLLAVCMHADKETGIFKLLL